LFLIYFQKYYYASSLIKLYYEVLFVVAQLKAAATRDKNKAKMQFANTRHLPLFCIPTNKTFHYTRRITPKRVTSLWYPSPHHTCNAKATQIPA